MNSTMRRTGAASRREGARFLIRQTLIALPFALAFGLLYGRGPASFLMALAISLIYSYVIGLAIAANTRWVAPHLVPPDCHPTGWDLVREAASYGAAGLAGSLVAALLVHLAIQPGYLASPRRVGIVLFYSLVFTALFMALAYARVYYRAYLERVRAEERMKADLAQAELRALRARIDPHFLFNALNSIAALIAVEPARAEAMTERLAEVFRYTLRGSRRETATLLDELQFVRAYVEIERTRMGERLRFEEQVDPATLTCRLPALLLQPLVENAVRHGAGARGEGGVVRLRAAARNGELVVEVEDDGPGFDPAAPAAGGFGLHSVSERLRMLGPGHAFEVESDPGRGTRVRLRLPVVSDPDR